MILIQIFLFMFFIYFFFFGKCIFSFFLLSIEFIIESKYLYFCGILKICGKIEKAYRLKSKKSYPNMKLIKFNLSANLKVYKKKSFEQTFLFKINSAQFKVFFFFLFVKIKFNLLWKHHQLKRQSENSLLI